MDIGTGIAIAGVWVFAGITMSAKTVSNMGTWISLIVAIGTTLFLR